MKLVLHFKSSKRKIPLEISPESTPTEQVKQVLEKNAIPLSDLKQIRFEKHALNNLEDLDSWYQQMEELAVFNQTRNKRLLPHEQFNVRPTSAEEALAEFKRNYPKNRLWQLAVDGQLYSSITGHSATKAEPDHGWVEYCQREDNSLNAFFTGLNVALENLENPFISEELILALHAAVTNNVFLGTNEGIARGAYRVDPPFFNFVPSQGRMTVSGLADLLDKIENHALSGPDEEHGEGVMLWPKFQGSQPCFISPAKIKEERRKYVGEGDNLAFASFLIDQGTAIHYQAPANPQTLVQQTIARYNETIGTLSDPDDRLKLIGETTEALERIHPFGDANGRTFVNLLQNRLLIQNGFPPATLFEPNIYDVYGHHVEVLKRGILNTIAIYNGENVFGYPMHRRHPLYPEKPDTVHSNYHFLNSQAYFDQNQELKQFSMQYDFNPLLPLFESDNPSLREIHDALANTPSPLDKLDYITEAINQLAEQPDAIVRLHRVFNDLVDAIPTPRYSHTAEDFELRELYYQAQVRLDIHQQNPVIVQLMQRSDRPDFTLAEESNDLEKHKEKEKGKGKEKEPETIQRRTIEKQTDKNKAPAIQLNAREQDLLRTLRKYIRLRQVEAEPEKKSKHYKSHFLGVKGGHSAKVKIRAAKKLMALVEDKPFRGEKLHSLDAMDYSALTSSRLGQMMEPYLDIIQHYANRALKFQASGG
ncbi:Fic family protein [Legionella sp. MW5194]|uniref:Fic family protein n=1 Tax=Legionella sp. MW5194 TaxID=2662448 RepID=UPI00193E36B2|nr:Fic family protein [Legionella sp. MW5194]